jgi:putative DNA primase/helicase
MDIQSILSKLENVKPTGTNQWMVKCPCHNDDKASLSLKVNPQSKLLVKCFAGCDWRNIYNALGLTSRPQNIPRTIDKTYDYRDENGNILFQSVRYKPKDFRQRRPDGKGGWINNLQGVRLVLYRLPELITSKNDDFVFIVEGEKDADRIVSLGQNATTNPMGAGKWRGLYNEHLKGKKIIILPDNDEPGRKHAQQVASSLYGTAAGIKIVNLSGLPEKGDVSNWLDSNEANTIEKLMEIIKAAEIYTAPANSEQNFQTTQKLLCSFPFTDTGSAERFIHLNKDHFRYNYDFEKWHWYNGKFWDRKRGEPEARGLVIKTARLLREEALQSDDSERRAAIEDYARKLEATNRINNTLREARAIPPTPCYASDFDKDNWLINCLNGTVDLRTGNLGPHSPDDMITQITAVNYIPEDKCPRFDSFLSQIMNGNDVLIRYVTRLLGMCLCGSISEQILPIFYGSGGNGKSVLLDTICGLMGDYAGEAAPDLLIQKRNPEHATEVADLLKKRLVIASETEEDAVLKVSLVKRLTGNAKLKARFMRQDFFEFERTHKMILVTNNKPTISENTDAIWRRVKLIPFAITIPENKQDKSLLLKLQSEWPGIFVKLVRGCLEWQQFGLAEPEEIENATFEYRQEQNPLGDFIEGRCKLGSFGVVPVSELKGNYENWLKEQSRESHLSAQQFNAAMRKFGCKYENQYWDGKMQKCWIGIDLRYD